MTTPHESVTREGGQESEAVPDSGLSTMPRRTCPACDHLRLSVRTYRLADGSTRDICVLCAKAQGARLAAPECSPTIDEIAIARVELVEAGAVKCHCERCKGQFTVAEHRKGMESLAVLTAATERAEATPPVTDPPYAESLPYAWPDPNEPEVVS